jgi:hypothetical protein
MATTILRGFHSNRPACAHERYEELEEFVDGFEATLLEEEEDSDDAFGADSEAAGFASDEPAESADLLSVEGALDFDE